MAWVYPKRRTFVPDCPLYVLAGSGLKDGIDGEIVHIPHGYVVPPKVRAALGVDRLRRLHFVRMLDHEPVPDATPPEQMPGMFVAKVTPDEHVSIRTPEQVRRARR